MAALLESKRPASQPPPFPLSLGDLGPPPALTPDAVLKGISQLPFHIIHALQTHHVAAHDAIQRVQQIPGELAKEASTKVQPLAEGLKEQLDEHAKGWRRNEIGRTVEFWGRAGGIYATYKVCQARAQLARTKEDKDRIWEEQHEQAAERLYELCTDLGGFFLKAGQFFAKPDIAPAAWVRKLSRLHDKVPADKFSKIKKVIERELGRQLSDVFEWVEEAPLGSASIAQVHKARLKGSHGKGKEHVAIKVQREGVEPLMLMDLRNIKGFATYLQKYELPFDLLSLLSEIEDEFCLEFDFNQEARAMDRIGQSLRSGGRSRRLQGGTPGRRKDKGKDATTSQLSPVIVPKSIPGLVTRQLLVMEYVDGVQILRMPEEVRKRGLDPNGPLARRAKGKIVKDLMLAFGQMMLRDGEFQADPHPGNILVLPGPKVALLDYGQTKALQKHHREAVAHLILAAATGDPVKIGEAFKIAGIETQKSPEEDPWSFKRMGCIMWDTKRSPGLSDSSPFSEESTLKRNSLNKFPKDLFFALKTIQFLRGLAMGMDVNISTAEMWRPMALDVLKESS